MVGEEHYGTAREVQRSWRYAELQDIIAILGMDELSEDDRRSSCTVHAASRSFLVAALLRGRAVHRHPGCARLHRGHHQGLQHDPRRELDQYPEAAFNLKGNIDEVIEAGEKMLAESAA